jgi:predicted ATPase
VAARLDDRFGLLTAGLRTALPRHRILRATLDWSYELLSEPERRLLCYSAIFPAGFTLEAASAVHPGRRVSSILEIIADLVAKSLLLLDASASGGRWRMLETIRAYALEKLVETGEADKIARLAAEYFRDLFRSRALGSPRQSESGDKSNDRRELDNVRAAIDWALSPNGDQRVGLELTAESAPLWFQLTLMEEYRQRAETALKRLQVQGSPDDEQEMRLQVAFGQALWYTDSFGNLESMRGAFKRAGELAERSGNTDIRLKALWGTWATNRGSGNHESARMAAIQYETIADLTGDKDSIILGARMLALTHHDLGNLNSAGQHVTSVLRRAPRVAAAPGNNLQVDARAAMLTLLARVKWLQGFADQAVAAAREAIDAALRTHHWFSICYVLFFAGGPVSLWIGDLTEAENRLEMLRDRTGAGYSEYAGFNRFSGIYAAVLRLRRGNESDALAAAYIEPRMQFPTIAGLGEMTRHPSISVPFPDDIRCDAPWSLPEVLRVDAELLLWRGGPGAVSGAEMKLQRSLELARQQSALSWELRTASSLARLWIGQDRPSEARELLAPVYSKFTEGFATLDVVAARAILESLH